MPPSLTTTPPHLSCGRRPLGAAALPAKLPSHAKSLNSTSRYHAVDIIGKPNSLAPGKVGFCTFVTN